MVAGTTWRLEGPIDGSYSLAVVNRELAKGLAACGVDLALISRDGPGHRPVDPAFLIENPLIAEMLKKTALPDVVFRNQYPPYVNDMDGKLRVLANYGWEESSFPQQWIVSFNRSLDLILVPSRFVAKTLRDNGCDRPICVVGYGADHAIGRSDQQERSNSDETGISLRFLHISSGFPRKSLDVLLQAWPLAFTAKDSVELVIKTFPNPHNQIEAQLAQMRSQHPNHAPVHLINEDIPDDDLRSLYDKADVIVCPSRGEGFGLPLAETLYMGKPVITTGFGGQIDFCSQSNAWLCDYDFEFARTHLATGNSIWANPDVRSLAQALKNASVASPEQRAAKGSAGRDVIDQQFTWKKVAENSIEAVARVKAAQPSAAPRIGWLSTWNSRCGIADYSRSLTNVFYNDDFRVFAESGVDLLQADEPFVTRCWQSGKTDTLDAVYDRIVDASLDAVVLQFNFGFFDLSQFGRLVERLSERDIDVYVILHSTMNVTQPDRTDSLASIASSLRKARRLLVHSVSDMNRLKEFGLVDNATIFPFGLPTASDQDRETMRGRLGFTGRKVVASFGYLLPNKGLPELIHAFAMLRLSQPDYHLLLLNSLYPIPQSAEEYALCLRQIEAFKLKDSVSLLTSFREEAEILSFLGAADLVVYPYQNTQESASAAVRLGLASLTPVACTPLAIFDDVRSFVKYLPGRTPADIAEGIDQFFAARSNDHQYESRRAMLQERSWPVISGQLNRLIEGEFRNKRLGFRF